MNDCHQSNLNLWILFIIIYLHKAQINYQQFFSLRLIVLDDRCQTGYNNGARTNNGVIQGVLTLVYLWHTLPTSVGKAVVFLFPIFWHMITQSLSALISAWIFPPLLLMWDYYNLYIRDFFFSWGSTNLSKHSIHSRLTLYSFTHSHYQNPKVINPRP